MNMLFKNRDIQIQRKFDSLKDGYKIEIKIRGLVLGDKRESESWGNTGRRRELEGEQEVELGLAVQCSFTSFVFVLNFYKIEIVSSIFIGNCLIKLF